jgi:hypothetical protein
VFAKAKLRVSASVDHPIVWEDDSHILVNARGVNHEYLIVRCDVDVATCEEAVNYGAPEPGLDVMLARPASLSATSSSAVPSPPFESEAASAAPECEKALVGLDVASSSRTTVGEARRLRVGPGSLVLKDSFDGIPDSEPAAWCWTRTPNGFDAYAVSGTDAIKVASITGLTNPPTGSPQIP